MSRPAHLLAQAALVRMIYDPAFARAVKRAPRTVLAHLPHALADELGAVDARALRRDRHRRERTLGQLCTELPASTTLALAESGRMSLLLGFYESALFHEAIEAGTAWVLALASYLEERLADGTLRSPHLAAVLALEIASARARREGEDPPRAPGPQHEQALLRRARGVVPVEVPDGALATLRAVEAHRFRLGLLPAWAQAADPPALDPLPTLGPARVAVVAVALSGEVSLVEIERPLHAVLVSLPAARTRRAVLEEATLRLAGDARAAAAALSSLVEDELIFTS